LGSAGTVKRHYENDFMRHPTSYDAPYVSYYMATVSEMGPMIVLGSVKAQGSKATRARDETT
jgi:hypothetical protein